MTNTAIVRNRTILASLLTTTLCVGATAFSQNPTVWDSSLLPETRGTVKQYSLTPRGDVDGFILREGTEVAFPPHLTSQMVFAIRPGDAVSVRGLKARTLPLIDAKSVTNLVSGVIVTDDGPPDGSGGTADQKTVTGKVSAALYGKRGEINGALLDDGTILRLPPPEAERMQSLLQPGQPVAVRGYTLATALGTVINANAIGSTPDQLTELSAPPPPPRVGPGRGPDGPADFAPVPPPSVPPPSPPRG
jgi:hypothetical protein